MASWHAFSWTILRAHQVRRKRPCWRQWSKRSGGSAAVGGAVMRRNLRTASEWQTWLLHSAGPATSMGVEEAIAAGAALDVQMGFGTTALHLAGSLCSVRNGLPAARARRSLEAIDHLQATPLMAAARSGCSDAVRLLLDHGAEVDARNGRLHRLMAAAEAGDVVSLGLLLDRGATPRWWPTMATPPCRWPDIAVRRRRRPFWRRAVLPLVQLPRPSTPPTSPWLSSGADEREESATITTGGVPSIVTLTLLATLRWAL